MLLIFSLSLGVISAQDVNQTVNSENDGLNLHLNSVKSFTDLNNDIQNVFNASGDEFNISNDYIFNDESDENIASIDLSNMNLTINGNNHVIDARNKANIFHMFFGNVTINDLTLVNGNKSILDAAFGSYVVFNNVCFVDNGTDSQSRSLVTAFYAGALIFNNCNFSSTAIHDSDIDASLSPVVVKDSVFSGGTTYGYGHINVVNCKLTVDNVTFEDLSAKYASAIFCYGYYLSVKNSRFRNINSNLTAGAIGIKFSVYSDDDEYLYLIENSTFENVSCKNNGGAIFFYSPEDESEDHYSTLDIVDCSFSNCNSSFGGVILQLGGNLAIVNSNFTDNFATISGGVIYTSCANLTIINSTLSDNGADSSAGAIFFDEGNLNITNSNIVGNKVNIVAPESPNMLYTYNAVVNFKNSFFNNTGLSIYGLLSNFTGLENLTDEFSLNNDEYKYYMISSSKSLVLLNNSITVDSLPSKFDLRDWNWEGDVYDQGLNGACWVFGSIGSLQSALLKSTGIKYTFSPNEMQDSILKYSRYGNKFFTEGGFSINAASYLLSWIGIKPKEADEYDELGKIFDFDGYNNETIRVQDVIFIYGQRNKTDNELKEALLKYGALPVSFNSEDEILEYYNNETAAFYRDKVEDSTHTVTLIGWDDKYPKENFIITPPGDGAWICKNSYGTDFGKNGYFYLSYYDKSFLYADKEMGMFISGAAGFIFENQIPYLINYETDFTGIGLFVGEAPYYSNEYDSISNDLIGAVGTYFNETGIEYELKIYVNDVLRHTQSGVSPFAGFRTIILDKYIPIKVGDHFKVVFKSNAAPVTFPSRQHYLPGVSFISDDGKNWTDILVMTGSVSLKVYTVLDDTKITGNKNIAVDYNGGSYFSVNVVTADGRKVGAGESVKFTIGGKTTTVKTNNDGIAKIKITQIPKKYTITTTYKGKSVKNTVTVKQVLTTSKVTVKKTAKKLTIKAKLKINGKLLKGKTIKFKLNGKTYTAKTNSKGIAQKTLGKKIIKNLKKGKTYTVKVTYLKDTIKTSCVVY